MEPSFFLTWLSDSAKGFLTKKTVKHWSFWEFVWWIQLASIEIQFWWIDFFEKPTSIWPPFFSKPWILKGWSYDVSWFFSVSQRSQHEFAWIQMSHFGMKRWNIEQRAMSNPALYCISPQTEKGFLTNLPHSWHFMIFLEVLFWLFCD